MTLYPFRCTWKKSPRARKFLSGITFHTDRMGAFRALVTMVKSEYEQGIPGGVDPLTCQEAFEAGVPSHVVHQGE